MFPAWLPFALPNWPQHGTALLCCLKVLLGACMLACITAQDGSLVWHICNDSVQTVLVSAESVDALG